MNFHAVGELQEIDTRIIEYSVGFENHANEFYQTQIQKEALDIFDQKQGKFL